MSLPSREELLRRLGPNDDPEVEARRQHIFRVLFEQESLESRRGLVARALERSRLPVTRDFLLHLLRLRQLAPSKEDEARIEACSDLATLDRWLDQAVTAASVSDAFA
jgi:hypothetical protein